MARNDAGFAIGGGGFPLRTKVWSGGFLLRTRAFGLWSACVPFSFAIGGCRLWWLLNDWYNQAIGRPWADVESARGFCFGCPRK